jgi:hypothetical protein
MQQAAGTGAVHDHAARFQFDAQFVQSQFAGLGHPLPHESGMRRKFAPARRMALTARRQRTGLATKLHQLVHKTRRHTEMPRSLPVPMTLVDKRGNTLTQRHR